jgi:hypothetical protein
MAARSTAVRLAAAAKAAGIAIPKGETKAVLAGASWLRECVARLEKAGLGKLET